MPRPVTDWRRLKRLKLVGGGTGMEGDRQSWLLLRGRVRRHPFHDPTTRHPRFLLVCGEGNSSWVKMLLVWSGSLVWLSLLDALSNSIPFDFIFTLGLHRIHVSAYPISFITSYFYERTKRTTYVYHVSCHFNSSLTSPSHCAVAAGAPPLLPFFYPITLSNDLPLLLPFLGPCRRGRYLCTSQ